MSPFYKAKYGSWRQRVIMLLYAVTEILDVLVFVLSLSFYKGDFTMIAALNPTLTKWSQS